MNGFDIHQVIPGDAAPLDEVAFVALDSLRRQGNEKVLEDKLLASFPDRRREILEAFGRVPEDSFNPTT